ncbi:MAG: HD domain-containing phosphohydrolase [Clostridium sp.]
MNGLFVKKGIGEGAKINTLQLLMSHRGLEVVYGYIPANGGIIVSNYEDNKKVEFVYILEGELQFEEDSKIISLKGGDCFYHNGLEKSFTIYAKKDSKVLTFSNCGEFHEVEEQTNKLSQVLNKIEDKDKYTKGHCSRVGLYAQKLANNSKVPVESMRELMMAANAHDVGKCMIPDEILLKTGKFTDEEREIMKKHSKYSYELLKNAFNLSEKVSMIAACHHERYNGSGYPYGLKGENIPIEARIIAIVDAFDAITTDRPYQKAKTPMEAIEEMNRDTYEYDPELFEIFKKLVYSKEITVSEISE